MSMLSNINFFPVLRGALLGVVAAWTLIVLGIAIHFQMSFVDSASQLTYVSLSVFVAVVTLTLFLVLLVAPCNRKISEILKTKWELLWLGVLSVLWTSLAGYTTTPAAKDNEVECWDEDEDGNVVDAHVEGYSNDVYHARYRVLQAFAFFNCVLLLFLFLFVLLLAFWHHRRGRYAIWTTRTTSVGWFDQPGGFGSALAKRLPAPITNRMSKAFGHKDDDEKYEKWDDDKQVGSGKKKHFKFDNDEKGRSVHKDKSKLKDTDLEEMGLIQKPAPAAHRDTNPNIKAAAAARNKSPEPKKTNTSTTPTATPLKPKQYMVGVPKDSVKPSLAPPKASGTTSGSAPIAARMEEEKKKSEVSRAISQREAADKARQEARRGRADDEERRPRATTRPSAPEVQRNISTARREPSQGHKRSESKPPAGATVGATRRETSRDSSGRQGQGSQPGVVRAGSGARRNGTSQARAQADNSDSNGNSNDNTRRAVPGRQGLTHSNLNNYRSNNPYRSATGKRV